MSLGPDEHQEARDEMKVWGNYFIGAIDALHEGDSGELARERLIGGPEQSDAELNRRLWMMLPVGAWIAGELLIRASGADGSGWFGLDMGDVDMAEPADRTAARLVTAAANRDDDQVMALVRAERDERGWQGVANALGALAAIAAPMWDRKPVDL